MGDARRHQHRPAPGAATDIDAGAAAGRQDRPRENAEIIVENIAALLVREMIFVLAEGRPFLAETAGDPLIDIIIGADLIIRADLHRQMARSRATAIAPLRMAEVLSDKISLSGGGSASPNAR